MSFKLILSIICLSICLSPILSQRFLAETLTGSKVLNAQIYVQQQTTDYYYYKVYSQDGQIQVEILDSKLDTQDLKFSKKDNSLVFRAAYNKYIIVEQKNSTGNSVSYWVIEIVKAQNGFVLQSFPVKSRIDDQGFELQDDYNLTSVIEYDPKQKVLYVILVTSSDEDIYAIDLKNKSNVLKTISWFFFSKEARQNIVGGNCRILVDATSNLFMFDTRNVRVNDSDPTIFDRVNISDYTTLPIYPGGSRVYNFIGSYFQYVSLSPDGLNMTTFLWQGQQKISKPLKEGSLNSSSTPIKFFSDQQTFFYAVADNEIYATGLRWVEETQEYEVFGYTLSENITDEDERKVRLTNFNSALIITYFNNRLYLLTSESFLVYGENQVYSKILEEPVKQGDDLAKTIMIEIKKYLESKS